MSSWPSFLLGLGVGLLLGLIVLALYAAVVMGSIDDERMGRNQ